MLLKRIHPFAAMHRWAKANYALLGWPQAPDRKTIRRRFLALPALIQQLMPTIAQQCQTLHHPTFGYACSFADKSVFRSLGGLWRKKHMLLKVVPHPSIDTEASWAKSEYHGWRFGYGLHLICNRYGTGHPAISPDGNRNNGFHQRLYATKDPDCPFAATPRHRRSR